MQASGAKTLRTHKTWGKPLANSRPGHRIFDYQKFDPSITIQKPVMLLSSAVTVLKATLSIIAHIYNNATLKPTRQSSRYGEE